MRRVVERYRMMMKRCDYSNSYRHNTVVCDHLDALLYGISVAWYGAKCNLILFLLNINVVLQIQQMSILYSMNITV